MARKQKSGQAAMEFLMTYGWAILVVLVVIGALAYFGILNPENFLPRRCILGSEISCVDWLLRSDGTFIIRLGNGIANRITLDTVAMNDTTFKNQIQSCTVGAGLPATLNPGEQTQTPLQATCTGTGLAVGSAIRGYITVQYTDTVTGFQHSVQGDFVTKVEP